MFTGIVQALGTIKSTHMHQQAHQQDLTLEIDAEQLFACTDSAFDLGESISINGVCLTVIRAKNQLIAFDVSAESLAVTLLGNLQAGDQVNLERALLPTTRMGGHFVSGHVDGLGTLIKKQDEGRSVRLTFATTRQLGRYIAVKGSITMDGISLTVNECEDQADRTQFGVNIVPHTMAMTTLERLAITQQVHVEVDIIARYLDRLNQV